MSDPLSLLVLPSPPDPAELRSGMRQLGVELQQLVLQLRSAPPSAHAVLRLRLRDHLEAARASLLGHYIRLPEFLRHYAVSLTEVQWSLDAWIAGSEAGSEDEPQLQRDFFRAASRLFAETETVQHSAAPPRPAAPPPRRGPGYRWWTALRAWWRSSRTAPQALLRRRVGTDHSA